MHGRHGSSVKMAAVNPTLGITIGAVFLIQDGDNVAYCMGTELRTRPTQRQSSGSTDGRLHGSYWIMGELECSLLPSTGCAAETSII